MYRYGKTTQTAIAVMSRLAQGYHEPDLWLASAEIAASRNLTKPLVSKVLNILAQGKLVIGTRGPSGGFRLARDPATITLLDVVQLFERPEDDLGCAFGPGWCGRSDAKCPLHDDLCEIRDRMIGYLTRTHLDVFRAPVPSAKPARKPKR